MLDKETGELILSGSLRLGPSLRQRRLPSLPISKPATSLIKNGAWHSYHIEADSINGEKLFISLQFFNSSLKMIDFVVDELKRGSDPPPDWRDETEQKRFHDKWLETCLGSPPPYDYGWGSVISSYDPRSDCSSIIVTYEKKGKGLMSLLFGCRV